MDLWSGLIDRLEASMKRQETALATTKAQLQAAYEARARQQELALPVSPGKK